ncbi:MAG: hypothetical protein U9P49_06355 [Thermodesulfobacteriota bacterium]|nr:hypothetical protein [Thermodesulfobacteriota bacterium]
MSKKMGNEIHDAYMDGLFEGKKEVIDELMMLIDTQMDELRKQREARK